VRSFRGWLARRSSAICVSIDLYIIETTTAGVSTTGETITHSSRSQSLRNSDAASAIAKTRRRSGLKADPDGQLWILETK
jgi:hypothetical protein